MLARLSALASTDDERAGVDFRRAVLWRECNAPAAQLLCRQLISRLKGAEQTSATAHKMVLALQSPSP